MQGVQTSPEGLPFRVPRPPALPGAVGAAVRRREKAAEAEGPPLAGSRRATALRCCLPVLQPL